MVRICEVKQAYIDPTYYCSEAKHSNNYINQSVGYISLYYRYHGSSLFHDDKYKKPNASKTTGWKDI